MSQNLEGPRRLAASIRERSAGGWPAIVPFVTAGFPSPAAFGDVLREIAPHAAAIEIGVPFTDPMADGPTIQRASRAALEQGVTLAWLLDELRGLRGDGLPPVVLMGYLNPFLAMGFEVLAERCAGAGVAAVIVPDLPIEESDACRAALHGCGVGLVQMVTPLTARERAGRIGGATDGFLYAVTRTGVTGDGGEGGLAREYLAGLRELTSAPVCAGFGIRSRGDVAAMRGCVDGVIVGSALIEALGRGESAGAFLAGLGEGG